MLHPSVRRELVDRYHDALPDDIRTYLKERGIPATLIERHRLGWNGERITIPVFGQGGDVVGFRYAQVPNDSSGGADVVSELGVGTELYGWDTLARAPHRVVICARELDRLVLEARGIPAVASTGGAHTFLEEWVPHFASIKHIYICFDRDLAGAAAAKHVQRLLPRARIAHLPPEVGHEGTVTDYFNALGRTAVDFEVVLAKADGADGDAGNYWPRAAQPLLPSDKSLRRRADRVRGAVQIHDLVANYTDLQASGKQLIGHCPFHDGGARSFAVDPARGTYWCSACGAAGDVLRFLMDKESMTVGQALEALEAYEVTHELFGSS